MVWKLSRDFINFLLTMIEEVRLILQDMYHNNRKLSITYMKRYCAKHGMSKRILRNTLDNLVAKVAGEARFRSRHNNVY